MNKIAHYGRDVVVLVGKYLAGSLVMAIGWALLLAPVTVILWGLYTGQPWHATRTVEMTTSYGILPTLELIVPLWLIGLIILWMLAFGPRM